MAVVVAVVVGVRAAGVVVVAVVVSVAGFTAVDVSDDRCDGEVQDDSANATVTARAMSAPRAGKRVVMLPIYDRAATLPMNLTTAITTISTFGSALARSGWPSRMASSLAPPLAKRQHRYDLLPRLSSIELAGAPKIMKTTFVGGPKSLPIRYELALRG